MQRLLGSQSFVGALVAVLQLVSRAVDAFWMALLEWSHAVGAWAITILLEWSHAVVAVVDGRNFSNSHREQNSFLKYSFCWTFSFLAGCHRCSGTALLATQLPLPPKGLLFFPFPFLFHKNNAQSSRQRYVVSTRMWATSPWSINVFVCY